MLQELDEIHVFDEDYVECIMICTVDNLETLKMIQEEIDDDEIFKGGMIMYSVMYQKIMRPLKIIAGMSS